jgi:hypothetical protein
VQCSEITAKPIDYCTAGREAGSPVLNMIARERSANLNEHLTTLVRHSKLARRDSDAALKVSDRLQRESAKLDAILNKFLKAS